MNRDDITYTIVKTRQGPDTIMVRSGGKDIYLHSRVDPAREKDLLAGRFDPVRYDILIVLGAGLGYHLIPLGEILEQYSEVILIDIIPGIEQAIRQNSLTSFLAASPRVTIISGESINGVEDILSAKIDMDRIRGISVLEHPASLRTFGEYYGRVREKVEKLIDIKAGNRATRKTFGGRYVSNILRNIRFMEGARPVRELYGAFRGYPAVLAVSGPSLDADIEWIGQNHRRFYIVAVDSALTALCGRGIAPDVVISIDPQPYVREHFLNCDTGGAPLVCSISSHPSVLARAGVFISLSSHPLSQLAREVYGDSIGSVDSGTGSVAGDAVCLCARCGFSAIGITGLDFSFSNYGIYARGTAYQKRYASFFQDRFTTAEGLNCGYILKGSGGLKREGKFTRKSFLQYRRSLEDFMHNEGIGNITLLNNRGLPLAGAQTGSLDGFMEKNCRTGLDKESVMRALAASSRGIAAGPMISALSNIMHESLFDEILDASCGGQAGDRERAKYRNLIDSLRSRTVKYMGLET